MAAFALAPSGRVGASGPSGTPVLYRMCLDKPMCDHTCCRRSRGSTGPTGRTAGQQSGGRTYCFSARQVWARSTLPWVRRHSSDQRSLCGLADRRRTPRAASSGRCRRIAPDAPSALLHGRGPRHRGAWRLCVGPLRRPPAFQGALVPVRARVDPHYAEQGDPRMARNDRRRLGVGHSDPPSLASPPSCDSDRGLQLPAARDPDESG